MHAPRSIVNTFVGRAYEIEVIRGMVDETAAGSSRIVTISGEPGVGKTSLAKQISAIAAGRGLLVLESRCYEQEGIPTYWPWIKLIRRYVETNDQAGADKIGKLANELAALFESENPSTGVSEPEPIQNRFYLFDTVARFLTALSRESPLMIFIDNLHCADLGSLQLLEFVAQECEDDRVMLLGTFRDNELTAEHPLNFTLGELSRSLGYTHLELRGLDNSEIIEFFRSDTPTGEPGFDDRLIDIVARKTDGNPLYLREVLVAQRSAGFDSVGITPENIEQRLKIPDTLRATIRSRIAGLGADGRLVLIAASLLGREFDVSLLGRFIRELIGKDLVTDIEESTLNQLLENARGAAIIDTVEDSPGVMRFSHALIQEVVLDDSSTAIDDPHLRAAAFLETHYDTDAKEHAPELYRHYLYARGDVSRERAQHFAYEAARGAWAKYAYEEIIEYLEPYAKSLETPADDQEAEMVSLLGRAYRDLGRLQEAANWLGRAFAYYENNRAFDTAIRIATERIFFFNEDEATVNWIARAEGLVDQNTESGLLIRAFATYNRMFQNREFETGRRELRRALETAQSLAFRKARLSSLIYLAFIENRSLRYSECLKYVDEAMVLVDGADDARLELSMRMLRYMASGAGSTKSEMAEIDVAVSIAERLRDRYLLSLTLHFRSRALLVSGLFDRAREDLERFRRLELLHAKPIRSVRNSAWIDAESGDFDSFRERLKEGFSRIGTWQNSAAFLPHAPRYARITGDLSILEPYRSVADRTQKDLEATIGMRWRALLFQGGTAHLENDREAAERIYPDLQKIYSKPEFTYSHEERTIALTAEAAGKFDEARNFFERALASHEAKNARIEIPWDCYDIARWHLSYEKPPNRDLILELLKRGRGIAAEIGMKPVLARIDGLLKQLGIDASTRTDADNQYEAPVTQPAADSGRFSKLTKREIDVLELVAKGLTNQEIARDLFISEHTAANHVRHILSKLEVSNRIEAATLATRHGLSADE